MNSTTVWGIIQETATRRFPADFTLKFSQHFPLQHLERFVSKINKRKRSPRMMHK